MRQKGESGRPSEERLARKVKGYGCGAWLLLTITIFLFVALVVSDLFIGGWAFGHSLLMLLGLMVLVVVSLVLFDMRECLRHHLELRKLLLEVQKSLEAGDDKHLPDPDEPSDSTPC